MDTLRFRFIPQPGVDYSEDQMSFKDSEGYRWHFGPNESKDLPVYGNIPGSAVGDIVVDSAEQPARV